MLWARILISNAINIPINKTFQNVELNIKYSNGQLKQRFLDYTLANFCGIYLFLMWVFKPYDYISKFVLADLYISH